MSDINKIILIVLDSVGCGELDDSEKYGDKGTNTLKHIFENMPKDFILQNLGNLGLYNIVPSPYGYNPKQITGNYGKMATLSPAKDTTAGHWELAGVVLDKPFPVYPNGFPPEIIDEFERQIGNKVLGNCVASGTEIIKQLGRQHCDTGRPIVYTSADSVFQIAAHEQPQGTNYQGLKDLYRYCEIARKILTGKHSVGRVIARPFVEIDGKFTRTSNRRDYSLNPFGTTVLDKIKSSSRQVVAIGKIHDIFNEQGISVSYHTTGNDMGIQRTIETIKNSPEGSFIFTNLVDFDMLWGHRRNLTAYAQGLKTFDDKLPEIISAMSQNDILIITADHGCDPSYLKHTDHTREYVPILVYGKSLKQNINIGTRKSLSDVAQTVADIWNLEPFKNGTSFKDEIL